MINLDLIQCICRNMLGCLLQITDSGCMGIKFNDHIQASSVMYTHPLTKAHSFRIFGSANLEKMIFFSSGV